MILFDGGKIHKFIGIKIRDCNCTQFILGNKCVTSSAGFQMVCLAKPVLETALAAINDMSEEKLELKNELVIFLSSNFEEKNFLTTKFDIHIFSFRNYRYAGLGSSYGGIIVV